MVDMGTHDEVLLFPSNRMEEGSTDIETNESSDPFSRDSKLRKALMGNLIFPLLLAENSKLTK